MRRSLKGVNFDNAHSNFAEIDGTCDGNCGGYTYHMKNTKLLSSTRVTDFRFHSDFVLDDIDGSFTGKAPGSKLIAKTATMSAQECTDAPAIFNKGVPASICSSATEFVRLVIGSVKPQTLEYQDLVFTTAHGALRVMHLNY